MANGHGGSRPNTGGARPRSGRIKKEHLATVKELIESAVTPDDFLEMTRAMVQRAKDGDVRAYTQIVDRMYGKVTDHIITEQVGDGAPVRIIFEEKPISE